MKRRAAWMLAALLLWLVGYPLLITALESFGWGGSAAAAESGWTLDHYREFASRSDEWLALWRSLWLSAASVLCAGLIGVPLAFVFERLEFPGRRWLGGLVALPVALPPLVGVIAFLFLYGESGFVTRSLMLVLGLDEAPWRLKGAGAILLVHTYSMYVYFYLFVRAALARFDSSLYEAAASLGAGRWQSFWKVTLPLLRPALLGAALLTFMTSLASFSAPYLFGDNFRVMTTQILASKLNGQLALARVETVTLAALAFVGLGFMRWADRKRAAVLGGTRGVAPSRRTVQKPALRWAAAAVGWLLAIFALLPHLTLILISFVPTNSWTVELLPPVYDLSNFREVFSSPERLRPVFNSVWMATVATIGAVSLGLLAADRSTRQGGRVGAWLETLVAVPWAIPGTVFAVALATAFSVHAPAIGRFVLVGTVWILPLAYLVRSLPVTGRSAFAGLRQFDHSLEEAAHSLGAGRWRTLRQIKFPLLRQAVLAGASLAFITALGDFVTSIVLYTYDTRPIAIEILSSLRLQEFGIAAVYGILLMILSGAAFVFWSDDSA